MLNLLTRLTFIISLIISFSGEARANDSDIVNCNKNWRIVVLGSSTAFGTGATEYDSSWVGKYTAYMKRRDITSEIINLAIPGFTTYQNLRPDGYTPPGGRPTPVSGFNITAALAQNPDAIIINMPSNDAFNDYTLSEQQANFEAALALTDAANIPVWVTTSQPRNNMTVAQIQNLTDLRDWIQTRFGDKAVDFWSLVSNPDGSIATFYDFDNVHVNNEGHRLFFTRMAAENILDSLCNRFTGTLVARAGNDQSIILPVNSITLDGSNSSSSGTITSYSWTKISGPATFNIVSPTAASTVVDNLVEGRYSFELTVTDDNSLTRSDTVNVVVSSRVLFDVGPTTTVSPDAGGKYWNNFADGLPGVKVSNAVTSANIATSISLEIINRIDGTFNIAGPGTNTGNTAGDVGDYGNDATTDFAFAHPSATNGQWKIAGLDDTKQYSIKFWGTRTVVDDRIIQIKRADQLVWQEYDAKNNTDFNSAATFTFSGQTEMTFDIRVKDGSAFGHICLVDITRSSIPAQGNLPPVARAGADQTITLPSTSTQVDGTLSSDDDGTIVSYQWTKITGPTTFNIVSPNSAITTIDNLVQGNYSFELRVTDNESGEDADTVNITVGSRVLFDIGNTVTNSPDAGGKYWNNVTDGLPGIKVSNAITTGNTATSINLEVINRIDGTFNPAGPGVNTGNTVGDVNDYPNSATTDFAFAHPSATNGQWKISGLDNSKEYTIKFWGARTAADQRIIEIKRNDETTWQSYDAANNTDYNRAAVFTFTGKSEMIFDIRVETESSFGHISVVDIKIADPIVTCNPVTPAVTVSAVPTGAICEGTTVTFTAAPTNGGTTPAYQWKKNGIDLPGETNATYTTNTLLNNDIITVQLTSSEECPTINPVTSADLTMTVNALLPVSVQIAASTATTICDGTSVTFTATPTNGGLNPTYQWFNGADPIVGETNNTYTTNSLINGDVISVQLTSDEVCATGNPATSNSITMTVNPLLPVSVQIASSTATTICDGTSVTFTATPTNGGLNPTYQWFNGANPIAGETNSTYTTNTLINGDLISVQLTSDEVCATGNPAISNSITMTVNPLLPVSVQITASTATTICDGTSVTFTATPTNGGLNPTYQWFNGANPIAGETNITYTTNTLINGDVISVQLTSDEVCATGNPATSNSITITVNPLLPVSVQIAASTATTICDGTSVTFTATPTNGGVNPTYQWFNGANPIAGETNSTYTTSTLINGDVISVQLTSDEVCATGNPATSNSITMTVNPLLPVSVQIAASTATTICEGTSVTFTATSTNGGVNPTYQWFNGANPIAGETNSTYTTNTLINGDLISVQLTSDEVCATGNPALSNSITMTVNPLLPVSVQIAASTATTICDGTSVTFTATPTNGGLNPTYQWFNGANPIAGETNSTYTTNTLINGDAISVQLTSDEVCATGNPAISNSITMTVNPLLPVSVQIAASTATTICNGTSVTFTATPTNGGLNPTYQWFNGANPIAGETNSTYTTNTLINGDAISVQLTSDEVCATGNPALSNSITMTVNPPLPVSVQIAASTATTICDGTSVTFTATPTNGGLNPTYQWFNGANPIAGETNSTYTTNTLINGDVISVQLTSDELCTTGNPATSNSITMTVNAVLPVSVSITVSPTDEICAGTSVTFTAIPVNGGDNPTYQWFSGINAIPGETGSTYTTSTLVNGEVISVVCKSNLTPCISNNPATSNSITMIVNPLLPVSASITASTGNSICDGTSVTFTATPTNGGSNPAYQWFNGANPILGETNSTYSTNALINGDIITVQLTSDEVCATGNPATSNIIVMTVNPILPVSVSIASANGTTVCDAATVTFAATPVNGGTSPVYQWFKGNNPIAGETGDTYTTNALQDADQISVQLTSSELCTSGNTAVSNVISMTIIPNLPVSVSITADPGNEICAGAPVTFTATPVNGGSNPAYQWLINNNPVNGEISNVFTTASLNNGDIVTVQLLSSETCTSGNPAISNGIAMIVNPILPVSVTITANPGSTVCFGSTVTFTATPVNGGITPAYQWLLNGVEIPGETGSTYTTSELVNRDEISVVLTSSEACNSGNPDTSNIITITLTRNIPVVVTIASDLGESICDGSTVIFTATPENGGSSPVYQWFLNGSPLGGETGNTYTNSVLQTGDQVFVTLLSNADCAIDNPATSDTLTMTVNPVLPVSVSISSNTGDVICDGTSVTFTATPVNGGATPAYQWFNGNNPIAGETGETYTSTSLQNADVISVQLTSSEFCTTGNPATSNSITMTVNPLLPVSVEISANPGNTICAGTPVSFTATPVNPGNNPVYQWLRNGNIVPGESNSTYTVTDLINGETITAVLVSDATPCATGNPATSNTITVTVSDVLPVSVNISNNTGNTICEGTQVVFTATPVNGGINPAYQWFNGSNPIAGETNSTYTSSTLVNADQISVKLTSDIPDCLVNNPASSNVVNMQVNPVLPVSVTISSNAGNSICSGTSVTFTASAVNGGTNPAYQWFNGANPIAGETNSTYTSSTLVNADQISVQLTSNETCTSGNPALSNSIVMTVNQLLPVSVSISANPGNNICDGTSVTFTATPVNGGLNPGYQWFNGANPIAGETNSTYTSNTLINGDVISVQLTSDEVCATGSPAVSNSITMTVNPVLPASIQISATPGNTICAGTSVTYTASITNGGLLPQLQWQLNGIAVPGETGNTYTTASISNNDIITCTLISSLVCATTTPVSSNAIIMTVNNPTSSVTTVNTCDPNYTWNGIVYNTSGTYTFTTVNAAGCDSIATLNLFFGGEFNVSSISGPGNACAYMGPGALIATYSVTAPGATSYNWNIPLTGSILSGQGTSSITVRFFSNFGSGSVIVTVGNPCGSPVTRSILVTRNVPAAPASINGPVNVCSFIGSGLTATYSINPVVNALTYRWTLPANVTLISASADSTSITVSFDPSFVSNLNKTLRVRSVSGCGTSGDRSLNLVAAVAPAPAQISGPVNACLFIGSENSATYTINKVVNATSYNWSVPAGATIIDHNGGTGINDTSIVVVYDNNFVSGTAITVSSNSTCGTSNNTILEIQRIAPGVPAFISGPTDVCPFVVGSPNRAVYSIPAVLNATGYNWTTPANTTVFHPAGTGENDTIIEVIYPADFISGNITVSASNGCATSVLKTLTVRKTIPATPVISGPTDPCPFIGNGTAVYTINRVLGATSYTWTVPAVGATAVHPFPDGVDDTVIIVTYTSDFVNGNITARANAFCANSSTRSLSIIRKLPSTPGLISTTVISAACPVRRYSYAINSLPANATGTFWTVPTGAVIDSGQGTLRIYVTYTPNAVAGEFVTVRGTNGCAASTTPRKLTINLAPCTGPFITGTVINEIGIEGKAMPNPTSSYFTLSFESNDRMIPATLTITDINGNLVEKRSNILPGQAIRTGDTFKKGIYLASFVQGKLRKTIKLFKL